MIQVLCGPLGHPLLEVLQTGPVRIAPYQFVAAALRPRLTLEIVDRELPAPFVAQLGGRVLLTAHLVDTLAAYARVSRHDYLRMVTLCGVAQARVFQRNPLMRPEDLYHREPTGCLFARRYLLEDYFHPLESPHICAGCRKFYGHLLPRREFAALREVIAVVARQARGASLGSS